MLRAIWNRLKSGDSQRPYMIYKVMNKGKHVQDTRIGSTTTLESEDNMDLGENVFIGHYNFIEASNGIRIGEGCQITNFISILSHSSHDSIRYYGRDYRKVKNPKGYMKGSVDIGAYVFIGPHVTIMPNTRIGKGSIVSAYSFVKGEFPDFSIISGNPATVIGSTVERDESFLREHSELHELYNEWVDRT